jgi:hypothetical protein
MEEYRDLHQMKAYVPEGSPILSHMPLGYWAEYVLDGDLIRDAKLPLDTVAYIVAENERLPPPRPGMVLLFRGVRLSLIKVGQERPPLF